ncbi:uncharacterized protein ACLA_055950 [Aspergillus clavatus NRRL 1]|uniref:Uncharacterized protein n=1 Tax=Aspergillus clavatus (strain ATCC 1007 / CBS 513.65 / DSM 816 / NCTC 3887 / NRRL 1 / QM 1276 / 107) TaxID=344612 RepID=A1C9M3_ASPCL|nr:uncharacterized protein ACLA_055950 [Aspergillus clavatus NRRL 1]EAW13547.1 hypothetical protein ACLA_055950 [Aspergillus clavatus NRRL 1]
MQSFDSGSLGPRDLLVNGAFCIEERTVLELLAFVLRAGDLPLTRDELKNRFGVEDFQYNDLSDIFQRLLVEYGNCARYSGLFKDLENICLKLIELSSRAKQDYDPIFANLKKIFKDEGDTDYLRRLVKQDVDNRLAEIRQLASTVDTATSNINDWDNANADHKYRLTDIVTDIEQRVENTPELKAKRDGFWGNYGDPVWRLEMSAVIDLIFSKAVIKDFQLLLGGWNALSNDLTNLGNFILNNTDPAPGLLANLEENAIIDQWQNLETEVRNLTNNVITPAVRKTTG